MEKGDLLNFGPYQWRVLTLADRRALVITEDIIALRWFHTQFVDVTWANCEVV